MEPGGGGGRHGGGVPHVAKLRRRGHDTQYGAALAIQRGRGYGHLHDSSCAGRQWSGARDRHGQCVAGSGRIAAGTGEPGCFRPGAGRILRLSADLGDRQWDGGERAVLVCGARFATSGDFDSVSGLLRLRKLVLDAGGCIPRGGCGGTSVYGIAAPAIGGVRIGYGAEPVQHGRHPGHLRGEYPHGHEYGEYAVELHGGRGYGDCDHSGDLRGDAEAEESELRSDWPAEACPTKGAYFCSQATVASHSRITGLGRSPCPRRRRAESTLRACKAKYNSSAAGSLPAAMTSVGVWK